MIIALFQIMTALWAIQVPADSKPVPQSADSEATGHRTPPPVAGFDSKQFATGISLDIAASRVEIEAAVVLREGPLELIVCTPGTREHESILVTAASPTQIYQAMGLVGLNPGKPVHIDPKTKSLVPATGQALTISVSWEQDGKRRVLPISRWVHDADGKAVDDRIGWVFSGSFVIQDNRLAADVEGTILSVVNFDSALVSISDLHVADDHALWLFANPRTIPPVGTICKLIIEPVVAGRSAAGPSDSRSVIKVSVFSGDRIEIDGARVNLAGFADRLKSAVGGGKTHVELWKSPDCQAAFVDQVRQRCVKAGLKVSVKRDSAGSKTGKPGV